MLAPSASSSYLKDGVPCPDFSEKLNSMGACMQKSAGHLYNSHRRISPQEIYNQIQKIKLQRRERIPKETLENPIEKEDQEKRKKALPISLKSFNAPSINRSIPPKRLAFRIVLGPEKIYSAAVPPI